MDSRQLIEHAEHCLRTNQPNMAVLYMKNARKSLIHERIARKAAEKGMTTEEYMESMRKSFDSLAASLKDMLKPFGEAIAQITKSFSRVSDPDDPQSYTLAN